MQVALIKQHHECFYYAFSFFCSSMKNRLFYLLLSLSLPCALVSCSTGTLRDVTSETGGTSTDILYEEALTNIAMIHFYDGHALLPSSYEISGGNVAINDTVGSTAGGSYASITHLFTPMVNVNGQRVFQKSWGVTPQDNLDCLKGLMTIYDDYANGHTNEFQYLDVDNAGKLKNPLPTTPIQYNRSGHLPDSKGLFHYGPPTVVEYVQGKYRGETVWVDPTDAHALEMLNDLVEDVLFAMQKADQALAATSGGKSKPGGVSPAASAPATQVQTFINPSRQ